MKTASYSRYVVAVIAIMIGLMFHATASAYSYAAAGKEPLIEEREAILTALSRGDYDSINSAVVNLKEEFDYLLTDHNVDLYTPMKSAIDVKNEQQIIAVIDQALVEEIIRRLEGAEKNLADYQVAKVLVVKSKLFLDLLLPKLSDNNRDVAMTAIQGVLASIGNPGVFGVGQAPADPEQFARQKAQLLLALDEMKLH